MNTIYKNHYFYLFHFYRNLKIIHSIPSISIKPLQATNINILIAFYNRDL